MSFMKLINVVILMLVAGISLASAREPTEGELKSLDETAGIYQIATKEGDIQKLVDSIPPRILKVLAETGETDEKQIVEITRKQIAVMTAMVKFVSCELQLDRKVAGELADGTPYFIIPLTSVIEANGQKTRVEAKMAAVLDGDRWYFITGGLDQKNIMGRAFPGLEKASFGEPVVTPLEN